MARPGDHTREPVSRLEVGGVTTRYRIRVDGALCQGSGVCAGMAPDYFEIGDDHRSQPLREVVDADDIVLDAADCCPAEAIAVSDADTGAPCRDFGA